MKLRAVTVAISLAISFSAGATMLTGSLTADDSFSSYLSTSDSVLGTLLTSSTNWKVATNLSTSLTAGQNYYLHVVANDTGYNYFGVLGSFALSDSSFKFANGTQTLSTDTTNWTAVQGSVAGWTAPTALPISSGASGVYPWGTSHLGTSATFAGIAPTAQWIWSATHAAGANAGVAYLSTQITAAVPEPETYAMLLAGLGLMGFIARRRGIRKA